jgi:hypothetical protein
MAESGNTDERITISSDDARGARGPKAGTVGDTLLPMLIGMIVLTIVGVFVILMIVR